jgi:hypothetical protein
MRRVNTLSHADVFSRSQLCIFSIRCRNPERRIILDRRTIWCHMHLRSGYTSHPPFGRVPPQGPFLKRLGHRCEQMKAVWLRMHSPQRWQRNTGIFTAFSNKSMAPESRLSPGEYGFHLVARFVFIPSAIEKCP